MFENQYSKLSIETSKMIKCAIQNSTTQNNSEICEHWLTVCDHELEERHRDILNQFIEATFFN